MSDLISRQPETHDKRTETHARDCIERQAAIDEIEERKNANGYRNVAVISELNRLEGYIMRLPSAQPEIIRCKECRHYGCILYSGTQFEYGECFGHEESDYTFEVKPDDFCSRAERRTDEAR